MEDLIIIPAVAVGMALFYVAADIAALAMGKGWRHYSKKRAAAKEERQQLKENLK